MRVAAYCRVSTDKHDQANSFINQKSFFTDYINKNPDWELYKIYADEGLSGTSVKKRNAFLGMIKDAEKKLFDIIITKEVSRFSRNILDTITYTRMLKKMGVGVIFLYDCISTINPDAELRLSIMGSIAQEESRKTSERVKWGQTRQMEKGVVFGRSLLGYDVKNGVMTINEEGAKVVKLIYHMYVNEIAPIHIIAKKLQVGGYRTLTGRSHWNSGVILKILKNEKYCGDLCQKKTYTPDYLSHEKKYNKDAEKKIYIRNHHEPIICRQLWEKAQEEIKRRSVRYGKDNIPEKYAYPLSGKIYCEKCGFCFVARSKKRKDGSRYIFWRCKTAVRYGVKGCDIRTQISNELCMDIIKQVLATIKIYKDDSLCRKTNIHNNHIFLAGLLERITVCENDRVEVCLQNLPTRWVFSVKRVHCDTSVPISVSIPITSS